MPQTDRSQTCKSCLEKSGKCWTTVAENDLHEGFCPVITDSEVRVCRVRGGRVSRVAAIDSTRAQRIL